MAIDLVRQPVTMLQNLSDRLKAEEQRWYAALPTRVVFTLVMVVAGLTLLLNFVNSSQQRPGAPAAATPAELAASAASSAASSSRSSADAASAAAAAIKAARQAASAASAVKAASRP
jgi:hypothetical protein